MLNHTNDALEILHSRYVRGKPHMQKLLDAEEHKSQLARVVYFHRIQAGLSRAELARKVKVSAQIIERIEEADYDPFSAVLLMEILWACTAKLNPERSPGSKSTKAGLEKRYRAQVSRLKPDTGKSYSFKKQKAKV